MSKHPNALPDVVARKLSDLAREHGYGIENLTLSWLTKDLGQPATARVSYSTANDVPYERAPARESVEESPEPVLVYEGRLGRSEYRRGDLVAHNKQIWVVIRVEEDLLEMVKASLPSKENRVRIHPKDFKP